MTDHVAISMEISLKGLATAQTNGSIKAFATTALSSLGYDSWAFACENPGSLFGNSHFSTGIPFQWLAIYLAKGYQSIDPVVMHCRTSEEPFLWDAVSGWESATEPVRDFMRNIHANGFGSGLAIPLRSSSGTKGMLSLVKTGRLTELRVSYLRSLPEARSIGMAIHAAIERLRSK